MLKGVQVRSEAAAGWEGMHRTYNACYDGALDAGRAHLGQPRTSMKVLYCTFDTFLRL